MVDPRFFGAPQPLTLAAIRELTGAAIEADPVGDAKSFGEVGALDSVGPEGVSFYHNRQYAQALSASRAGLIFLAEDDLSRLPAGALAGVTADPYRAYALVARALYPLPAITPGIHPRAVVDPSAVVDASAAIAAGAVIGAGVRVGARSSIGANSVVGDHCEIGSDARIGPNVTLSHAILGNRVRVLAGAVIGERGFGFAMGPFGHLPVPQLGRVLIEDDVEIGAGTAIDRGAGPDTVIGAGSKIDNLVQIGHNVRVGRGCVLCGAVAIAGSTVLEDFVVLGGGVGVNGHITLAMGTRVGGGSMVLGSTEAGSTLLGSPAIDSRKFMKYQASLYRLTGIKR